MGGNKGKSKEEKAHDAEAAGVAGGKEQQAVADDAEQARLSPASDPAGGENYQPPSHYAQGEAEGTDARLHGEDAEQPAGRTVDGTEPAEAQQPLHMQATDGGPNADYRPSVEDAGVAARADSVIKVRIETRGVPNERVQEFVRNLREQGIDADAGEDLAVPATRSFEEADHAKSFAEGYAAALNAVAVVIDGTHYVDRRGTTLAEALDANDVRLRAQLAAIAERSQPAEVPAES
jgi:hypothetical protein